jgi:hypothetical protein
VNDGHSYHWQVDHRMTVIRVRGSYKAVCQCGEQSEKGTHEEVEAWVKTHLESVRV